MGQIVNMETYARARSVTPTREARPTVAVAESLDMQACGISGCHVRGFMIHETGEYDPPARAQEGREGGGELTQRSGEDVREQHVGAAWQSNT